MLKKWLKEYHYHLKDHLGNTRTTFTTKPKEIVFNVSYEGNTDEFLLQEMDNIVDADIHDYQHQDEETNHTKTQKLTGAQNSQVGSILSIPVGMGDKISAEVFAKYLPTNNQANPTAAIASLITSAFTGTTGINNELTNQAITTSFSGGSMITNSANNYTYDDQGVMAFLNVIFIPKEAETNITADQFAFSQLSNSATNHEKLEIIDFTAPKAGYILVYLTNEDPTYTEVFFDDLKVNINEHSVIQVDNYYPFGMVHSNEYQRISAKKNKLNTFQNQERIDDLDLGWYAFKWRNHDPTIARFFNIDPLADTYNSWSPYAFSGNMVTSHVELEGLEPYDYRYLFALTHEAKTGKKGAVEKQIKANYWEAAGAIVGVMLWVNLGIAVDLSTAGATMVEDNDSDASDSTPEDPTPEEPEPDPNKGVYEFEDTEGKDYTGQSKDIDRRLKEHERSGKKDPSTPVKRTGVEGGKTERELKETEILDSKGGADTKNNPNPNVSNKKRPVSKKREKELKSNGGG